MTNTRSYTTVTAYLLTYLVTRYGRSMLCIVVIMQAATRPIGADSMGVMERSPLGQKAVGAMPPSRRPTEILLCHF